MTAAPARVSSFYTYVGDEKYRRAFSRAEYRFYSFVPAKSDDGTPIAIGGQYGVKITRTGDGVACRFRTGDLELLRACDSPQQGVAMSRVGGTVGSGVRVAPECGLRLMAVDFRRSGHVRSVLQIRSD
jgi:hypothetical protein